MAYLLRLRALRPQVAVRPSSPFLVRGSWTTSSVAATRNSPWQTHDQARRSFSRRIQRQPEDSDAPLMEVFAPGTGPKPPSEARNGNGNGSGKEKTKLSKQEQHRLRQAQSTVQSWPSDPAEMRRVLEQERREQGSRSGPILDLQEDDDGDIVGGRRVRSRKYTGALPPRPDWVWVGACVEGTDTPMNGVLVQVPRDSGLPELIMMVKGVHSLPDTILDCLDIWANDQPLDPGVTLDSIGFRDGDNLSLRALNRPNTRIPRGALLKVEPLEYPVRHLGASALMNAVQAGDMHQVNLWLTSKSVNGQDGMGLTPLMYAAMYADLEIFEHLMKAGGSIWHKLEQGLTMMHLAARNPDGAPIIRLLASLGLRADGAVDVNEVQNAVESLPPQFEATSRGLTDNVVALLEAKADPNRSYGENGNPLMHALQCSELGSLEALLSFGADPNLNVNPEMSPLLMASHSTRAWLLRPLLEAGADPNFRSSINGATALHIATATHQPEMVKLLLEHKADPNVPDLERHMPLDIALEQNHLELIRLLAEGGANLSRVDPEGVPPLGAALLPDELDAALILIEAKADVNFEFETGETLLAVARSPEAMRLLVEHKADINHTPKKGVNANTQITPLMTHARDGHPDLIPTMLELGARPELVDDSGLTAIHWALSGKHAKRALRALASAGVDLDLQPDPSIKTGLQVAVEHEHLDLVDFLLRRGADPERTLPGDAVRNCFDLAMSSRNQSLIALLESWRNKHLEGFQNADGVSQQLEEGEQSELSEISEVSDEATEDHSEYSSSSAVEDSDASDVDHDHHDGRH